MRPAITALGEAERMPCSSVFSQEAVPDDTARRFHCQVYKWLIGINRISLGYPRAGLPYKGMNQRGIPQFHAESNHPTTPGHSRTNRTQPVIFHFRAGGMRE